MRRSCSVVFYHSLTAESRSFLRETTRRFKFAGSSTRFSDRRESISGNIKSQNFVKLPRWWPGLFSSRTKAKCGDAPTLRSLQRKRRNCCKIWAKIAERHIGMRNVYIFRFLLLSAGMWRSSNDGLQATVAFDWQSVKSETLDCVGLFQLWPRSGFLLDWPVQSIIITLDNCSGLSAHDFVVLFRAFLALCICMLLGCLWLEVRTWGFLLESSS